MAFNILILLTGLIWSCEKTVSPHQITDKDPLFEILWTTELNPPEGIIGTDFTQHYKDWFLVGGDLHEPPTILAFNKITGKKDWEYIHQGLVNDEIKVSIIHENIYIAICKHGVVGIDLDTRESIWELDFYPLDYYKENSNSIYDNYLYLNIQIGGAGLYANSAAIIKINIFTGEHEKIFEIEKQGEDLTSFSPPTFWNDPNTNKVLMILNEYPKSQLAPQEDEQNIIAIDLNTNKVVWRTDNFTENFYSNSLHPPIIYNNIVITGGDWSMYTFNTETGKQRWRYEFDYTVGIWSKTNHLIYDDKLYVNNGQHDVSCLNPLSGELIWNNPKGGANCTDNMVYYEKEDYLVFTSWGYGSVMILDAITGETIHQEEGYLNTNYTDDVVYDKDLDMFFVTTYDHAIGFKINAPE